MEKTFTPEEMHTLWSKEGHITIAGTKYRVGKMSYGDYFLEPGRPQGETKPFNRGTLWLEKTTDKKAYQIDMLLSDL